MKKCIVAICMLAMINVLGMDNGLVSQLHSELIQATAQPQYIRGLLSSGANPNVSDRHGNISLHKAKNPTHIRALLECGAQINAQNGIQYTPLMQHIYLRHHQAAEYLMASGASLSLYDNAGATALHHAVRVANESSDNQADCKIVQSLLQHGAYFDEVDSTGERLFTAYTDSKLKKIVEPYIQSVMWNAFGKKLDNTVTYLVNNYPWALMWCKADEKQMLLWDQKVCIKAGDHHIVLECLKDGWCIKCLSHDYVIKKVGGC